MNLNMSSKTRGLFLFVAAMLVISGCTKERPTKYLFKERNHLKSLVDENAEYLYVPSLADGSRKSDGMYPHWMGYEKLVKLKFNETSLDIIEQDSEARFANNQQNNVTILSIPVKHIEYRCQTNDLGECQNKEEENNEMNWKDKSQFIPDFSGMKIAEVSVTPLEMDNYWDGCYQLQKEELAGYSLEQDAINIQIERTYQTSPNCLMSLESYSDITFKAQYHYSMVKLSTLASPNYQAINYSKGDQDKFGFFETVRRNLSPDNLDEEKNEVTYLNRWNSNKKQITYYLTDNFYKPENAAVLAATREGVAAINLALSQSGAGFQLVLSDERGKMSGDLRNSMIVMVEDPSNAGLLGYGPSVANPRTGEILSGRTVMYLGTLKEMLKTEYEHLVNLETAGKLAGGIHSPSPAMAKAAAPAEIAAIALKHNHSHETLGEVAVQTGENTEPVVGTVKESSAMKRAHKMLTDYTKNRKDMKRIYDGKKPKNTDPFEYDEREDLVAILANHNATSAELVNFHEAVVRTIKEVLGGELTPWDEMSDSLKEKVINHMISIVWVPTLIHEIGHNLGLRHNFEGSEDIPNFYTRDELDRLSSVIKYAPTAMVPNYSSIMDYAPNDVENLRQMGKYDVAALRFGYARKIEVLDTEVNKKGEKLSESVRYVDVDGTVAGVEGRIASDNQKATELLEQNKAETVTTSSVKSYGFCTDEHVGLNAGCFRFDLGMEPDTTEANKYTRMVKGLIAQYEEMYLRRNFRNGRYNFSMMDDPSYLRRVTGTFLNLRIFQEVRERIQYLSGFPPNVWDNPMNPAWAKDLNQASKLAGQFLLDVMTTPEVLCLVQNPNEPEKLTEIIPLKELTSIVDAPEVLSCMDKTLQDTLMSWGLANPNLKMPLISVSQVGKHFESKKDPASTNNYMDQIDVRGIWMDKMAAARMLFRRSLNYSFDVGPDNFADRTDLNATIKTFVTNILKDEIQVKLNFPLPDGSVYTTPEAVSYRLYPTHKIRKHMLANYGVPFIPQDVDFQSTLLTGIEFYQPNALNKASSQAVVDQFSVYKGAYPVNTGWTDKDFATVRTPIGSFFALPTQKLARDAIQGETLAQAMTQAGGSAFASKMQQAKATAVRAQADFDANTKPLKAKRDQWAREADYKPVLDAVSATSSVELDQYLAGTLAEGDVKAKLDALDNAKLKEVAANVLAQRAFDTTKAKTNEAILFVQNKLTDEALKAEFNAYVNVFGGGTEGKAEYTNVVGMCQAIQNGQVPANGSPAVKLAWTAPDNVVTRFIEDPAYYVGLLDRLISAK